MSSSSKRYAAALERVRLRAIRAAELGTPAPRHERLSELEEQLATVEAFLVETAPGARDGALARALGCGPDELDVLWTAVAVTADPRLWPHLQRLGGPETARGTSLGLHALLAQLDATRSLELGLAFGPDHAWFRFALLEAADDLAWAARRFRAPPRVATFLAGDDRPDPIIAELGGIVTVPAWMEIDEASSQAYSRIDRALETDEAMLIVVDGSPGVGRRTAIAAAASAVGRPAIAIDVSRLGSTTAALDDALSALTREVVLTGALPILVGVDDIGTSEAEAEAVLLRRIARAIERMPGTVAVVTLQHGIDLGVSRPIVRISMPLPSTATRRRLWDRALADLPAVEVSDAQRDDHATRYRLGAGAIAAAVRSARHVATGPIGLADLEAGVRNNIAERMGGLAHRTVVRQRWDELVLGKDTLDQVRALIARVRHQHLVLEEWGLGAKLHRGNGVAALFSGPPGTGKTMVAGLIAIALGLELYQVDLSKVVSKWVGETEKQLARIFDAAEAGHALLLFDEADALFAKRTEVKAAVDRYANLEVNYLLQRVEAFGGITILTTNLDQSIDPALMRRLAAHIKFWPPELEERIALWRAMLGARVPVASDIDFAELASEYPEMSGANVRNAAIAAAFLAASDGKPVDQSYLVRAARGEYAAMGRILGG